MKNIIFNCKKFTDSDREIINNYSGIIIEHGDYYELHQFYKEDDWDYIDYNESLNELIDDNDVEEYVLIESLNDLYKLVNKEIIYELW